jgi:hypothetical protein
VRGAALDLVSATNSPRTISSSCRRNGPVVLGAVHHAVDVVRVVRPAEREERLRRELDAELLPDLAARASSNDSPAASTPPIATSQCDG